MPTICTHTYMLFIIVIPYATTIQQIFIILKLKVQNKGKQIEKGARKVEKKKNE